MRFISILKDTQLQITEYKSKENGNVLDEKWMSLRDNMIQVLNQPNGQNLTKDVIRTLHQTQRKERAQLEKKILNTHGHRIRSYFADGTDIDPLKISPELVLINKSDSIEGDVFRAATLIWSIPVSHGYGRRMRYLVIDKQNGKLIGIFALGDPVFNLKCRDNWIGWNVNQRRDRLAFVLDAYVLGAVPPYSFVLGGKLVGSLLASKEIQVAFCDRYSHKKGSISNQAKNSHLVLITTTSALGRSSIYNRLRLPDIVNFIKIGTTEGWGHFLVTEDLFAQARELLREHNDPYANNYKFGQGPSWRLRALRKACLYLGVDQQMLRHGIKREVYGIPIAPLWRETLLGTESVSNYEKKLLAAHDIGEAAKVRWIIPRASRMGKWRDWNHNETWSIITQHVLNDE